MKTIVTNDLPMYFMAELYRHRVSERPVEPITRLVKAERPGVGGVTGLILIRDANGDFFVEVERHNGEYESGWAKAFDNDIIAALFDVIDSGS
jgi:hypothetical protein